MAKDEKYGIGKRFKNSKGYWFEIIGKTTKYGYRGFREIKFDSGYETVASQWEIKNGTIKDLKSPNVCGVGIMDLDSAKENPLYEKWVSMLQRCYIETHKAYKYYGAKGIYVCDEWLVFSNFERDIKLKDNYENMISEKRKWHLDKDLLSGDKKCYSNETTCIIRSCDNNRERNKRSGHPSDTQKKCVIQTDMHGNFLNRFNSISEASKITGCSAGNICSCCKGKSIQTKGFKWKYDE